MRLHALTLWKQFSLFWQVERKRILLPQVEVVGFSPWYTLAMRREGFLAYGARRVSECVCALNVRLSVLAADDLQAVEEALAAAHRLQTCLTLFASGYPSPRVALWKRRLRRIVRALNALRDCLRLAEWVGAQQPPLTHKPGVQRALLRLRQRAETLHQTLLHGWQRWRADRIPNEIVGLSKRWGQSFGDEAVDPDYALGRWRLFSREQLGALESPAPSLAVQCGRVRALLEACELLAPLQLPLECPDDLQARYETLETQRFRDEAHRLLRELLQQERERTLQHAGDLRGFGRIRKGWEWLMEQFENPHPLLE
jgi:hypothetical protein